MGPVLAPLQKLDRGQVPATTHQFANARVNDDGRTDVGDGKSVDAPDQSFAAETNWLNDRKNVRVCRARRSNCLPRTYGRYIYALLDIQSASFASCAVVGSIVSSW